MLQQLCPEQQRVLQPWVRLEEQSVNQKSTAKGSATKNPAQNEERSTHKQQPARTLCKQRGINSPNELFRMWSALPWAAFLNFSLLLQKFPALCSRSFSTPETHFSGSLCQVVQISNKNVHFCRAGEQIFSN